MQKAEPEKQLTIRNLYPNLNQEELKEAEARLNQYLELSLRMYERIRHDPDAYARLKQLLAEEEERKNRKEGKVAE